MGEKGLQKLGGISAILEGLIYIAAFIVYGGILVYPEADASTNERFEFVANNYLTLSILNFTSYILFGILLVVLVLAIHHRLKPHSPIPSKITAIFGMIWVGLVIASGMIGNIGLNQVMKIGSEDPERAMVVFTSVNVITEGLGGGNEIVGGIWVLLLSLIALKGGSLPKALNYLGVLVGMAGILTTYPLDLFKEIFGLGQIFWFVWIGSFMIRRA